MKIYAVNGSPRKKWNTAQVLESALEGARSAGAQTEMIHLYDLSYQGCVSCLQCKRAGGKSYGKCALKDPLTPILEKLAEADGIVFGSPIYFSNITGKLVCMLERLLFQYHTYHAGYATIAPKRMNTAFVYTMNANEQWMTELGYDKILGAIQSVIGRVFTPPQVLYVCDTHQIDDYAKYEIESFSEAAKLEHKARQFPLDLKRAFDIGAGLASAS